VPIATMGFGMKTQDLLRSVAASFVSNDRGSVFTTFGLILVPMLVAGGVAVEYPGLPETVRNCSQHWMPPFWAALSNRSISAPLKRPRFSMPTFQLALSLPA
jgi:hypothetical protein